MKNYRLKRAVVATLTLAWCFMSSPAHSDIKNTHGELIFSNEQIEAARTNPAYEDLRDKLISTANSVLNITGHPVDTLDLNTNYYNYENRIVKLVMAYLITDDERYFDKTVEYLDKMSSYETWDYWCGSDLITSHFIMGLSFAYDYLYDELDPELKERVRERLLQEMEEKFYNKHKGFFDTNLTVQWKLLGNHLWLNNVAIYQAAIALRDEIPADRKAEYIDTTRKMMIEKVMPLLPEDGCGTEIGHYSLYGLHYLLQFMEIKKMNEGANLYTNSEYFKNIMYYLHHILFPDYKIYVNIGDGSNKEHGPTSQSYYYRLAAEFRDPILQHLALSYSESFPMNDTYPAFSLLWYDANLEPQSPGSSTPKIALFKTNGQVVYRNSWDSDALYINFLCGQLKTGHGHPDQNQFIIYHKGNHLLTDHGYTYWKTTQEHSTLLIDGWGQIGENYIWLPGDLCSDLADTYNFFTDEDNLYVHFTGDATRSYRPQAELELFQRHFSIFGNYVFIVDKVKTRTPKAMEIRFHNSDLSKAVDSGNRFTITEPEKIANLTVNDSQIIFYLDETKHSSIEPTYYVPKYGYPGLSTQGLYAYVKAYYKAKRPYRTSNNMSTGKVFDDFTDDGHPPPQHGFHISQKTNEDATDAVFKNLLIIGDAGDSSPIVKNINTDTLTGYEIETTDKKILYLFNTTDNMELLNTYKAISFKGLMVTAIFDKATDAETYYTKKATVKGEPPPPPPPSIVLGDVTGNGRVSSYDASLTAQYAIGLIDLTPDAVLRADVTQNSDVSSYDASLIAQYAIGLIDEF